MNLSLNKNPAQSKKTSNLSGTCAIPGDKSISHRSLIIGSQLLGTSLIYNMLEGEDVICTANALRSAGVPIVHDIKNGVWIVKGVGIGGLNQPDNVLDMGNSGTSTRLLAGLFAPYPFVTMFTGDASLRKRPMKRVISPLSEIGARFMTRDEMRLPMAMQGTSHPVPICYTLPVASAQVKSALMLAALNIAGDTTVIEPIPTRDHTERMFEAVGISVTLSQQEDGMHITVHGQPKQSYADRELTVPGDPSSAAFLVVAALITEQSEVTLTNICMNPSRTGVYVTLKEMGADISILNEREVQGEPVADMRVRSSTLKAVDVPENRAPSMIDEYPIVAMAAACAEGVTVLRGLEELRVKESDRFAAVVDGLRACGVRVDAEGDTMIIHGSSNIIGDASIATHMDHRIAMSFLVLGLVTEAPVTVDDVSAINTSFPQFMRMMRGLGASMHTLGSKQNLVLPLRRKDDQRLVIAIDGPAASGKGTLSRLLADSFQIPHLDTGGLYRATALRLLAQGGDPNSEDDALRAARTVNVHDLSNPQLREERVGNVASVVSSLSSVRHVLLEFQRNFAAQDEGAILDGRDIGTVVCPDALVKIFVTASIEVRAERRHRQLQAQGIEVVYDSVLKDLISRDKRDTERKVAPLLPAMDAIYIDTTKMTIAEVFDEVVARIRRDMLERVERVR